MNTTWHIAVSLGSSWLEPFFWTSLWWWLQQCWWSCRLTLRPSLPGVSSVMDRACGAKKGGHRKESHFTKSVVLVPDHLAKVTLGVFRVRFFFLSPRNLQCQCHFPSFQSVPPKAHSALQPWGLPCTPLLFPLTWDIVSIPVPMSVPAFSELQCEAEATTVFTKPNCG